MEKIEQEERTIVQLQLQIYDYFKLKKIEPYSQKENARCVRSACYKFESQLCRRVSGLLSKEVKKKLDSFDVRQENTQISDEEEENAEFQHLKHSPSGVTKKHIHHQIKKLQTLRSIGVPKHALMSFSRKIMQKYDKRIMSKHPSHIRLHKESVRYTMFASFCYIRLQKTTDVLVDQFRTILNRVRLKAESVIKQKILQSVTRVDGKFDTLYSLAEVTLSCPKEIIEDAVYPTVSENKLKDIMVDLEHRGKWYSHQVGRQMCSSYLTGCRAQILALLEVIELKSHNPAQANFLKALQVIKKYASSSKKLIPLEEDVPLEGVVDSKWISLVCDKPTGQIRRIYYEVAVFEELRSRLNYKDVWVADGDKYGNPDLDTPQDFYTNKSAYFKDLKLPQNAKMFVAALKKEMSEKLSYLNKTVPKNNKVKILKKKNGWIQLTPYIPQKEPLKLTMLQKAVQKRWKSVSLLDLLKEVEWRTGFTQLFENAASCTKINPDVLKKRLLLCLFFGNKHWS